MNITYTEEGIRLTKSSGDTEHAQREGVFTFFKKSTEQMGIVWMADRNGYGMWYLWLGERWARIHVYSLVTKFFAEGAANIRCQIVRDAVLN